MEAIRQVFEIGLDLDLFEIYMNQISTIDFECIFEFPVVEIGQVAITRASDHGYFRILGS